MVIDVHEGAVVLELPAVIGRGKDRYQFSVPVELVPLLDYLVRPADQVHVEVLQELIDHVLAEGITDSSLVLSPAFDVGVGIGPEQIAEQTLIWNFNGPFDADDIGEVEEIGGESSVHADDLLIDDCADGHDVEDIEEVLPDLEVVTPLAWIGGKVHSSQKPQMRLMLEFSWLPRSRKKFSGNLSLQQSSSMMHSIEFLPRSTQSPMNRQLLSPGQPPYSNTLSRSLNCPWMSPEIATRVPQILTGAYSSSSMGCSRSNSRLFMQTVLISRSSSFWDDP